MRFLADMGVNLPVVDWLRAHGHDANHLREEGLARLTDRDIFDKAVAEERIALTSTSTSARSPLSLAVERWG